MNSFIKNKYSIFLLAFFLNCHIVSSQEKIQADLKTITFLEKSPYKELNNSSSESLLRMLYFRPQPKNNAKIGFLDTKGNIRIKPIYGMASDFYDGYANIIKDSVYGYIDKSGKETMFKQYQETYFYYGNTGVAKQNGKYGLIDRKGKQLTDFKYNMMLFFGFDRFKGILSPVNNQLLDNDGNIIFNENLAYNIMCDYFGKDFSMVYQVKVNNKAMQGLINLDGTIITNPIYDNISFIEDKEFFVVEKNKKFGYINSKGLVVIPIIYDEVSYEITKDLISVKINNKFGFINRKNETIIPIEYDKSYPFFDGLAFVNKGQQSGFIDLKNNFKNILRVELINNDPLSSALADYLFEQ